ncbi:alpha-L-fucosidase [Paenibacillus roseipurpureus]|uniref:alpha-L-fucosidase n=1 Tax=Paenibacillus roseopurpureus TaxID=2918901 RepID=A0AA96LKM8_9BACL|nr:alpha-L-fucosidase [Paenibacillus sp. MBLB1832]WNR42788.1 alpha-L-fucosidase [Paenibacillus sp. MBLB1832]
MTSTKGNHGNAVQDQHQLIGAASSQIEGTYASNSHSGAQWFKDAGLGLFIHWGISSVHGDSDLSWGMIADTPWDSNPHRVKPSDYFKLAEQFQPDSYDPDLWLKPAADAGFTYAVLTTRHHDGYAMWPSRFGEYGTRTHMNSRDLVRPFVESCRRNNLKVGLYYSPPDWYYNREYMSFGYKHRKGEGPALGLEHEPIELPAKPDGWDEQFQQYVRGQIIELLTEYGQVDIIWFDGGEEVKDAISIEEIRELQPGIIISPRMHGGGDYISSECYNWVKSITSKPTQIWEHCDVWSSHPAGIWGYTHKTEAYRPTSWMLSLLSRVRAWGGNLLLNIGPRPDGTLPDDLFVRFDEIKEWMSVHRQAIFDVDSDDYQLYSSVPVTKRGDTWYLHLLPEHTGPVTLEGISRPASVRLLRNAQDLSFEWNDSDNRFTLNLPASWNGETLDIVEIRL